MGIVLSRGRGEREERGSEKGGREEAKETGARAEIKEKGGEKRGKGIGD